MKALIAGALLPVTLIVWWVYRRDRLPEPPRVVAATFALGALAVIPIIIVERMVASTGHQLGLAPADMQVTTLIHAGFTAFLVAALVEEGFKFAVLMGYSARHDAFDEPMDGIVYGVAASLGFAAIENLAYVLGAADSGQGAGLGVAFLRSFTAVPMHASCGIVMGACVGIGRFSAGRRVQWVLFGFAAAFVLHGLYDFLLFAGDALGAQAQPGFAAISVLSALGVSALGVVVSALAVARLRRDQEFALAAAGPPIVVAMHVEVSASTAGGLGNSNEFVADWVARTPPAPPGVPRLPMLALVLAAGSAAALVAEIVACLLAAETEPSEAFGLLVLLVLVAGILSGVAAVGVGLIAAIGSARWRAASVAAIVAGGLALMVHLSLVFIGIVVAQQGGDAESAAVPTCPAEGAFA